MLDVYLSFLKYDKAKRQILYKLNKFEEQFTKGEFSYLRLDGLTNLFSFINNLNLDQLAIFLAIEDTQDVNNTVTFKILSSILIKNDAFSFSPISIQEKQKALEILQKLFSIHTYSKDKIAVECGGFKVLLEYVESTDSATLQMTTLDTLQSLLIDSKTNQKSFLQSKGLEKIINVVKHKKYAKEVRIKCGDLLSYFVKNVVIEEVTKGIEDALGTPVLTLLLKDDPIVKEEFIKLIEEKKKEKTKRRMSFLKEEEKLLMEEEKLLKEEERMLLRKQDDTGGTGQTTKD